MNAEREPQVYQSAVFKLNKSQAVRIPKKIAFSDEVTSVSVVRRGASIVLTPLDRSWDSWFDHDLAVSEDYMNDREQPTHQEREAL